MASGFPMDGENSASSKESAIVHDASSINGDDPPLAPSDEMDQTQFDNVPRQENRLEDSDGDGGDEGEEDEDEEDDEEDENSVDEDEDSGHEGEEDEDENSFDEEGEIADHEDDNFRVEAIRSKRIFEGEVQYLIKWFGLPESDNTWMPLENIHPVFRQMVDAFEERSRSQYAKLVAHFSQPKESLQRPTVGDGDADRLAAHFQAANISSGNGQLNGQSVQGGCLRGAKKRKASHLKRQLAGTLEPERTKTTDFVGNQSHTNTVGEARNTSNIVKIIRPIAHSGNGSQEVSLTFIVLRDDGAEIAMTNHYLKAHHPLLLIDFYEKHIQYNRQRLDRITEGVNPPETGKNY